MLKLATVVCCALIFGVVSRPAHLNRDREALKYLRVAGYYDKPVEEINSMSDVEAAAALAEPLKEMQEFYNLNTQDGTLDHETEKIMKRPRCGRPDNYKSPALKVKRSLRYKRWSRLGSQVWNIMPVTIGFKNYWNGNIDQTTQENVVLSCARKWAEQSGLSFRLVRNSVANVYIHFDVIPGDSGPYGTIGYSLSPTPNHNPPSSKVLMDSREPWKPFATSGGQGISLEEGLCHEIGHALGLGHTSTRDSIMLPSLPNWSYDVKLSSDDIAGIQALYGGPNGQTIVGSPGVPTNPPETTQRSTTTRATTKMTPRTTFPPSEPERTTKPPATNSPVQPETERTTPNNRTPSPPQGDDCERYRSWQEKERCYRNQKREDPWNHPNNWEGPYYDEDQPYFKKETFKQDWWRS